MRNEPRVLHNSTPVRNSHCWPFLSCRAKALSVQKSTESLENKNLREFSHLLLNRKKLNLPWKLSQIPPPAVEIGKMPRSWCPKPWHSAGLWLIRVSRVLHRAESSRRAPLQPPQHPAALLVLGTRLALGAAAPRVSAGSPLHPLPEPAPPALGPWCQRLCDTVPQH